MRQIARTVSRQFAPKSSAYRELWLREGDQSEKIAESQHGEEPFYGQAYLPRKFKIGFALPEDNCIDVLTHDLGFVAVVENKCLIGFNVFVGGGMGVTPARKDTFPAVASPLGFVSHQDVVPITTTVMELYRDYGKRSDRKVSRMKYLIADWGLERFKEHVKRKSGEALRPPNAPSIHGVQDHLGWHDDGSGNLFLGLYIPNGRIADSEHVQTKSALRTVASRLAPEIRITPHQNLLLCNVSPESRPEVSDVLRDHGISLDLNVLSPRRQAMACPSFPTCGLAITEAERVMPTILTDIEEVLSRHGIADETLSIRMTGCPNGCTRPYVAEIGIVGKARGKYTLFLGGSHNGTRIAFVYRDMVPALEIAVALEPVIALFVLQRQRGESFGDFCYRVGRDNLLGNAIQQTEG